MAESQKAEKPESERQTPEERAKNIELLEALLHHAKNEGLELTTSAHTFESPFTGEEISIFIAQIVIAGSPKMPTMS